jgi:hypothetical protein
MGRSESAAGTSGATPGTWGLCFNANAPLTIDSVTIILNTTAGGTLVVQLRDSLIGSNGPGTNIVASASIPVPIGAVGDRVRIPLGFSVPAGNGYRLLAISGPSLIRSSSAGGFPYNASNGTAAITSGFITTSGNTTYYFFYDWKISTGCSSPLQPVVATVTPSDPILVTPSSITRCQYEAASSIIATSVANYNYTWSPSLGLNTTSGASVDASPLSTTTYTVTGDDGVCASITTITVNVQAAPAGLTASSNAPLCEGSTLNLSSNSSVAGYTMNGACTTGFIDISTTGTSVPVALSDDSEHNISIPSFTLNGTTFTTARVGMNGVIALGSTAGDITTTNATLPTSANTAGNVLLVPYWDDLDIQSSPTIKTETVGSVFIIQYNNVTHDILASTTASITFQVQLDLVSGTITYVYSDVDFGNPTYDYGVSATVGLQLSSSNAIQYSFNAASLTNGQCISFTPNTALTSYSWSGPSAFSSASQNPTIPMVTTAEAGTYTVTATSSVNGCSTSTTVNIIVNTSTHQSPHPVSDCDSYTWPTNGQTYSSSGQYTSTYLNSNGCLSYDTIDLTILLSTSASVSETAYGCYTWPVNGMNYSNSGTYIATILNAAGCDSVITLNLTIIPAITVKAKAMLSGPYDANTGLMHDSLRVMNQIPLTEPYSSAPYNLMPLGETSGESISSSLLTVTGSNAIVDWVVLELRSAANSATVLANKRALIQRDGDIVSHLDGSSPVAFTSLSDGNYYVTVKHRNHLGIMTANTVALSACSSSIDLTSDPLWVKPGLLNAPSRVYGSVKALWSSDANRNKNSKYNGVSNDKETVLMALGGIGFANSTLSPVYRPEDLNMDGKVRYNNTDNDRLVIINTVGVTTPNAIVNQHTPN